MCSRFSLLIAFLTFAWVTQVPAGAQNVAHESVPALNDVQARN